MTNKYFATNYLNRYPYKWVVNCSNKTVCSNYSHRRCKHDNSYRHIENCVPNHCGRFKLPLKVKFKMCLSILKGDIKFIK